MNTGTRRHSCFPVSILSVNSEAPLFPPLSHPHSPLNFQFVRYGKEAQKGYCGRFNGGRRPSATPDNS
ncbi:hypothetical protein L2E82_02602 [Cichorium intybus]|uniref:Uncharacterized protein n=1 Tax=Cichorium intybus TaxID=13427 RepID=A0ACB9H394_CICIN|nr:hypothetical protein L2E82_02602 [Cichorium intybus]